MSLEATPRKPRVALAVIPLLLLISLVGLFVAFGPAGVFPGDFPTVEDLSFGKVTLHEEGLDISVTNGGPEPVTVAQLLINEAYWEHEISPSRTIKRLKTATISVPYSWTEGEPIEIVLITDVGTTFAHEIAIATETPPVDATFLLTFALLGIYIGVIPVAVGMTWLPFLRTLSVRWLHFLLAFTAGVLAFLGVEALVEAIEESKELPTAVGGVGVVAVAALAAFLGILAWSRKMQRARQGKGRLVVAYAVAAGIGLHNLGEGLAVGGAYRLGEIALGAFLVVGFAIHNTTEGIGIVSILGDRKTAFKHLLLLGALAGAPTILGAWIGAFLFSPLIAVVFLAIAAGAIAEVIVDVLKVVRDEAHGGLMSPEALGGLAIGLIVMYVTGLFVAA